MDLAGYTTIESARDLDALRAALGAEKVNLWGISYGTHLALAALKVMERRIDRLVLASVEGLDQTVKLPARTDRYFERIQQAIDRDPASKALYPDAVGLIRRVLVRLDSAPVRVTIPGEGGSTSFLKLGDVTFVTVAGAGHNLFMVSPAVGALIQRFLAGETVSDTTVEVELTAFRS